MHKYYLNHLQELEAEAIFVIREVVANLISRQFCFQGERIRLL